MRSVISRNAMPERMEPAMKPLPFYAVRAVAVALVLLSVGNARGLEKDDLEQEQWQRRLDAKQLEDLEEKVRNVYAKALPAVVRIVGAREGANELRGIGSGVIVSRSGEILTCAHFDWPPGTKVTVELADRSHVQGTVLGSVKKPKEGYVRTHDVGMIQLDEKRDWPAVTLGRPSDLDNGQICPAIGYPYTVKLGRPPMLRLGRVLPPRGYGTVLCSCRILGGDSGGPLFDLEGRLLGVANGSCSLRWACSGYASVDVFMQLRDQLRNNEEIVAERKHPGVPVLPRKYKWSAFAPAEGLANGLGGAHRSAVEIFCNGKLVALGAIVESGGLVITKRTEVAACGEITCRLADGSRLAALIVAGSQEYDLTLLKVDAADLPKTSWAEAGEPQVGQLIASIGPDPRPLHFGVVGGIHVDNPAETGYLPIIGKSETPMGLAGLVFAEVWRNGPDAGNLGSLLKPGDLITHIDDIPTPTQHEYLKVVKKHVTGPRAMVGERIKLSVLRGKETMQVFAPIITNDNLLPALWKECPLSLRRNGFPNVFAHDGGTTPDQCGGPVVNQAGEVVGINIARADMIQTFAIPSGIVRTIIAQLKEIALLREAHEIINGR